MFPADFDDNDNVTRVSVLRSTRDRILCTGQYARKMIFSSSVFWAGTAMNRILWRWSVKILVRSNRCTARQEKINEIRSWWRSGPQDSALRSTILDDSLPDPASHT